MPSDVVLDVYGASYNTSTKVYANNVYIGTVEAYDNTDVSVMYHKNEYGDKIREDKVNDNKNMFTIPATKIASRLIKSHIDIFERSFFVVIPITAKAKKTMDVIKKILIILDLSLIHI